MESVGVGTLNQLGFASFLVNSKDSNCVFSTAEDRCTVEIHGVRRAIANVNNPAVRMHVNSAGRLGGMNILRIRQGVFDKLRSRAEGAVIKHSVHLKLVLGF